MSPRSGSPEIFFQSILTDSAILAEFAVIFVSTLTIFTFFSEVAPTKASNRLP